MTAFVLTRDKSSGPGTLTVDDPRPVVAGDGVTIGSAGGVATFSAVEVTIPAGAVAQGSTVTVVPLAPLGEKLGEVFGTPVGVEHAQPLEVPVTIRWNASALTPLQRDVAVLARWDPELAMWRPASETLTVEGESLVAHVSEFSYLTFVSIGQTIGEIINKRANAPRCADKPLHGWVRDVVDPDEELSSAAIRVCFEPDRDEIVTVRVVNNRTFSQRLTITTGDEWAWTWPGPEETGVAAAVYSAARSLDNRSTYLLPPLTEVAVGVARPAGAGQHVITAAAKVDAVSVMTDVIVYVLDQVPVGGTDNILLDALLQVLYECGGKQALQRDFGGDIGAMLRGVVDAITGCATEIRRPDSEFGIFFEELSRQIIAAHPGLPANVVVRTNRLTYQLINVMSALRYFDLAFYLSDQLANSATGSLSLSIRGDGMPQQLGAWQPACDDLSVDSNRLYRNLALQDSFLDTQKELWEFAEWQPSAKTAVQPLSACSVDYLAQFVTFLPASWGDPRAAQIVADEVRKLAGLPASTAAGTVPQSSADLVAYVNAGQPISASEFEWGSYGGPLQPTDYPLFTTPSGNINCWYSHSGGLHCHIHQFSFEPPRKPNCGPVTWVPGFMAVTDGGVVQRGVCTGDNLGPPNSKTLPYGRTVNYDGLACRSESAFLACADLATGAGFIVSRDEFKAYGTVKEAPDLSLWIMRPQPSISHHPR